jgi:uncharacterized protein (DUF305 family)
MTTRTNMTLVAAVAAAVTISGALGGCGTTTAPSSSSPSSSSAVGQTHNQADIAFAQDMIRHHAQAIAMSKMAAQQAGSPQVKELAARIQVEQQPEIDQLSGLLRAWNAPVPPMAGMGQGNMGSMGGAMPGMMTSGEMQQLGQATGAAFDRMFLQMMISHHQGAVMMAKTELNNGQNPDARQLAQRIIDAQQHEITEMRTLLGG